MQERLRVNSSIIGSRAVPNLRSDAARPHAFMWWVIAFQCHTQLHTRVAKLRLIHQIVSMADQIVDHRFSRLDNKRTHAAAQVSTPGCSSPGAVSQPRFLQPFDPSRS